MLRNYKFIIAYDGTRFFGWERQPGRDTIQGKLESVLTRLQGSPVEIIGAGRTTPESMPGPWRPTPSWTWTCPRRRSGTI